MDEEGVTRMITFTVEPFVGPLPLQFGMTPTEVEAILGPPDRVFPDHFGNMSESRKHLSIGYSAATGLLIEVVFAPGSQLFFQGQNLFSVSNPIDFLRKSDPLPQLCVGFVFFLMLGIRLSGFHDHDDMQKAIGVTAKGHWDEFKDDFVPFGARGG